ncbi:MAG TPA: HIT family protein [Pseudomonas sp.]|nr:HIT family protein [Pseudomonas sp.]
MDCVFCAIAAGSLPAHLLHEDEHYLVLLDIFPMRPAHVLVISREHAPYLHDLSAPARERLLPLAERVAHALRVAGYGRQGIHLVINDGPASNQHVPHLHLHLVPRSAGDLPKLVWRLLTRFLPFGRRALQERLAIEAGLLRDALKQGC